ncbi:MAG: NUDIX domain-containing protein [Alistipes sp.]|nr:NUDIX domain-containing protein [Alistipes sp.]
MIKIFYGDRVLLFTGCGVVLPDGFRAVPAGGSFAKMIENLEKYKLVAVVSPDPEGAAAGFTAGFRAVDAAGGVAGNGRGGLLMIMRNGRWDLPKGHREPGETFAECALREVAEETGARCILEEDQPIVTTRHFYRLNGEWEMKRTEWYRMRSEDGELIPQTAEGITGAVWVPRGEVPEKAGTCFPSIREVLCVAGWLG